MFKISILVLCLIGFWQSLMGQPVQVGAERQPLLRDRLGSRKVALLVNHTARVGSGHLLDTLLAQGIDVVEIFSPEHGFRGDAPNGVAVQSKIDEQTGIPIVSLYGTNKKPIAEQLQLADVVVFDVQDVGTRFYTYTSTLHYLMEACAENKKQLIVLDRPNPNGHYVDGPVLQQPYRSFVGMHPVPVVHGMTVGEYAQMINGEQWLSGGIQCPLEVIQILHYTHQTPYTLQIPPSPNLPTPQAVALYPSLCFFEGTALSVGRGTEKPFQCVGHPLLKEKGVPYAFTPHSTHASLHPPLENQRCYGRDLCNTSVKNGIDLSHLLEMYRLFPDKKRFFNAFFNKLAGNAELRRQIEQGWNEEKIKSTWKADLEKYRAMRKKYLLYPE